MLRGVKLRVSLEWKTETIVRLNVKQHSHEKKMVSFQMTWMREITEDDTGKRIGIMIVAKWIFCLIRMVSYRRLTRVNVS